MRFVTSVHGVSTGQKINQINLDQPEDAGRLPETRTRLLTKPPYSREQVGIQIRRSQPQPATRILDLNTSPAPPSIASSTMSASQSGELLMTGRTCSHSACNTIDLLPFKCHHCNQSFCQEHWKPEQHLCNKYDPATEDRIVPQCPLCNDPVTIPAGGDVNYTMDLHILTDCSVALTKKKKGPHCANPKCGKALISPIVCQVHASSRTGRASVLLTALLLP